MTMDDLLHKGESELKAAVDPLIAQRDGKIKRVHEAVAQHRVDHPGVTVDDEAAAATIDSVFRTHNHKIESARTQIYTRHADALEAARIDEAQAIVQEGRAFLARFEDFARFENRRAKFLATCGVQPTANLSRENFSQELAAWLFGVEQAIAPRPAKTQAPRLRDRIKELIGA